MGKRLVFDFNKKEYNSYRAMKGRCYLKSYWAYQRYGGRGIKVCDRWLGKNGFDNFFKDMGNKPSDKHSLDRIDNNGDYTPENCRWAIQIVQVRNSEKVRRISINGIVKPLTVWCELNNINPATAWTRINKQGWSDVRAVTEATHRRTPLIP